jgi:hypothetical protein
MGVPASAALLAFVNAVQSTPCGQPDTGASAMAAIGATRQTVANEIGDDATCEAAATIAAFNGLVRVADGTGIQLDGGVFATSAQDREQLGINSFGGAANSADVTADTSAKLTEVSSLFG